MSRYRGPRFKRIRRLGTLPGLTSKIPRPSRSTRVYRADHRQEFPTDRKIQYGIRQKEKQKLHFHYGLTERQLLRYVHIAGKSKGSAGQVLLQLLEMRLDNILFRLGMASTIPGARQLVNHRHILVNDRIVDIPSYRCKPGDIITTKDKQRSKTLIQNNIAALSSHKKVPKHLTIDSVHNKGLVNQIIDSKSIGLEINGLIVVEYYSRQI
uniref:Small ribosomal subunit protein uS4c n=1 Tax=Zantedeschia elliottiana TaxID=94108 RepID=A0A6M3W1N1_9ARAE|nr:ribosomal protein S4 [Zantedeschia elliottiana]